MRQSTQKKIFAVFIILTFALSSVAYVTSVFTGVEPEQPKPKQLESFVVEGQLDELTESAYVEAGFTSLRFYYSDGALLGFVEQLPVITETNTGQQQLIVQKIPDNETYASIITVDNAEEIRNVTKASMMKALCRLLTIMPLECISLQGNVTA